MKAVPKKIKEIREKILEKEPGSSSISFSQLSIYLNCPHCWYRTYIKKEAPFAPSIHTCFGTSVHETIQHWLDVMYNKSVKASNELDLHAYLLSRMKENYVADKKNLGQDFTTKEELQEFYEDGVAILDYLKKHRSQFFSSRGEWLVGCEIPILYKLQNKFYFKGFIDVVTYNEDTKKFKIWDIKTSTRSWSAETKSNKNKTDQVLLYKRYFSRQFDVPEEDIDVEYFIVKRKVDENAEYPSMRKRVQEFIPINGSVSMNRAENKILEFCKDVLVEGQEGYANKEYVPTPSEKACKWCIFKESCSQAYKAGL